MYSLARTSRAISYVEGISRCGNDSDVHHFNVAYVIRLPGAPEQLGVLGIPPRPCENCIEFASGRIYVAME